MGQLCDVFDGGKKALLGILYMLNSDQHGCKPRLREDDRARRHSSYLLCKSLSGFPKIHTILR